MKYVSAIKIVPYEEGIEVWLSPLKVVIVRESGEYKHISQQAEACGRLYKLWGVQFVFDQATNTTYFRVDK